MLNGNLKVNVGELSLLLVKDGDNKNTVHATADYLIFPHMYSYLKYTINVSLKQISCN